MGSIALTVLSLTLGLFFILVGQFKVTPKFFPEVHEDMRREFGRVNKVFPLYQVTGWRPLAKNYRLFVGMAEIGCGSFLAIVPGRSKQIANIILLILMLGAVYTHYILNDKFERMAPGLVFSLLLLTRLIIHRQVERGEKKGKKEEFVKVIKKPIVKKADEAAKVADEDEDDDDEDDIAAEDVDSEQDSAVEEETTQIVKQKNAPGRVQPENKKKI